MEFNSTSLAEPVQLDHLVDQTFLLTSLFMMIQTVLFLMMPQNKFVQRLCGHVSFSFLSTTLTSDASDVFKAEPIEKKSAENIVADCEDGVISREEVEMMLARMQIDDEQRVKPQMGLDDFSRIFEDEEPSLEEVREAFVVFDRNNDGFLDAEDLQRVIPMLGFVEKLQLDLCEQMVKAYDQNNDGKIDFVEFVKLMEISLS